MSAGSMCVAHLCDSFSPLTQTFIYSYITELERQGLDNRVLTKQRVNEVDRPFGKVTVVREPKRWNPKRLWHRARYQLEVVMGTRHISDALWPLLRTRLRRVLARMQPDVLHAHFGTMGVIAAPVTEALGIPLVTSLYGFDVSKLARKDFWRKSYANTWSAVRAVTVLSQEMHQATVALGCPPEKIHIVHLSRNLDQFAYRPSSESSPKHFVSVGRLRKKKGHLDAIRAFERVSEHGHDVHLKIIGGGELREELSAYVQARGLEEVVELVGPLPNAEVARAMQQADAFVLCSKTAPSGDREGTPTVLVEAQAVGLPCISTFHAGIPEVIPEGNHWLLAHEGQVDEIADRIEQLLACTPGDVRSIAEAGRAQVEHAFNLEREAGKLRDVYEQVQHPQPAVTL